MAIELRRSCDPALCDECFYVGEGDFACMRKNTNPVFVISDWKPTKHYMECKSSPKRVKNRKRRKGNV